MNSKRKMWTAVARIAAIAVLPLALLTTVSSPGGSDATTTTTAATTTVNPIDLTAPAIPNNLSLPGPVAPTFTVSPSVGLLTLSPSQGPAGTPMHISGTGLPANSSVSLDWATSNATWVADVEPDTVNYLGESFSKLNVVIGTVTTDASGAFSTIIDAPSDFGGLHQINAVVNNVELDYITFTLMRTITVTPKSGPIGTLIHITYTGMGASLYTGGASLLWDNHYAGEMMGNWTRGTAEITIPAAGPVGTHYMQIGNAISYMYMNVIQSPITYTNGFVVPFKVTADDGPSASQIAWPVNVTPTVSEVTTLQSAGLDPDSTATATLSSQRGPVDSKVNLTVTGLPASAGTTDSLVWSTVVGNRVNCSSTCWAFSSNPLGSGTVSNGDLSASITVPDGLGGWHVVQVLNSSGEIEAQAPYYIMESIVSVKGDTAKDQGIATANDANTPAAIAVGQSGVGTNVFKEGQEFTISINGVGWTQLDNTLGVDYDNSYMGYGCGFNSNGYMVIHLHADGAPGTHVIDLYPMLYSLSPSFASTPYGMDPVLSSGRDYPGLALGYHVPIIRFSITVVK